jgi:hypothetical protein
MAMVTATATFNGHESDLANVMSPTTQPIGDKTMHNGKPKFPLGRTVATPGALADRKSVV